MDTEVEGKKKIVVQSQERRGIPGERSSVSGSAARSGKRKAGKGVLDLAIPWNGDERSMMGWGGKWKQCIYIYSDIDYFKC